MGEQRYASDISREQFELIRPLLEKVRKRTKSRVVDLYEVFCAILYLLKTGCQWRLLPHNFPKWVTVYKYFQDWRCKTKEEESTWLEEALKKLVGQRKAYTSFYIIDSQRVKNTDTEKKRL